MLRGSHVAVVVLAVVAGLMLAAAPLSSPLVSTPAAAAALPPPVIELAPPAPDTSVERVRGELLRAVQDCPGSASVVVSSPKNGWEVSYRGDATRPAASVIKLPIMVALYLRAARGALSLDAPVTITRADLTPGSGVLKNRPVGGAYPVRELIELMIAESDNIATNALIRVADREILNAEFAELGLRVTRLDHEILRGADDNPTSAEEMARLLALIARPEASPDRPAAWHELRASDLKAMRATLGHTKNRRRLARYLPDSTAVEHKTGTLREVVHDVGIIRSGGEEVVVSVLVTDSPNQEKSEQWVGKLGRRLFDAFFDMNEMERRQALSNAR